MAISILKFENLNFSENNSASKNVSLSVVFSIAAHLIVLIIVKLLNFTAILSLNLAVINFLPFPALDGGRIVFLLIEKIKGKAIKRDTETMIHNIGFLILMALIVLVTYKDIARFF